MVSTERLLSLLQNLIRVQSVNPDLVDGGNGEFEIARRIGAYMEFMGLDVRYQELCPGRSNVIGVLKGAGGGTSLMLNGHIDTVTVDGMDIDPLDPVFKDGRVYGRGSFDMKGGVAAMIEAVHAVKMAGIPLRGDVVVACVCDEEYASIGTEAVAREYVTGAAIVTEPTGVNICVAHKGFAWIKVNVRGKAAHGSLPSAGIDAIIGAGKLLVEVDRYAREILAQKRHILLGPPSVHGSLIEGGSNLSTYPSSCVVQLERRTIPGETRETVVSEMEQIVSRLKEEDPSFSATVDVFFYRSPFEVSSDESVVRAVRESAREVLGKEPEYVGTAAWLDSSILSDAGIPTVVFGPDGDGAHSAVEYVDFRSVVDTARALVGAIIRIAG